MIGTKLGPYEITAKLGEGGMGEVYRAHDPKLKRDVAIKVLPAAFTQDKERLARFEREAQLLAQLNHPNIAQIYGLETSGESHALVMELVEGPTLADRLARGALPLDEAFSLAKQIAEALEEAHEKGIVHRDLKPQNVKASIEGKAKVLDFGLAKAMDPAAGSASAVAGDLARSPAMMQSPTLTAVHGTQLGVILGTAAYMAPEQARGGAVDKRADIWAFGVVLFEMLTGRRLFEGETTSDTLAAVLRQEIDWTALPTATPSAIRGVLRRCLERNPRNRLRDIGDARLAIDEAVGGGEPAPSPSAPPVAARRSGLALGLAAAAAAAGLLAGWLLRGAHAPGGAEPARQLPSFRQLTRLPGGESRPTISPDGESFVFTKRDGPGEDYDLFLQRIDGAKAIPLTTDCEDDDLDPAFSPDGRSIAYRSECGGGGIFVMGVTGESNRRVTDLGFTPTWSPDGSELAVVTEGIESPTSRNSTSELWAVRVDSGKRRRVTEHDAVGPTWSPDGRRIAFWGLRAQSFQRDLWSVAADGSQRAAEAAVPILDDPALDWAPVYSRDGRWLYFASTRGGTFNLWRVAIDPASGERRDEPEPLTAPSSWAGPLSISADGRRILYVDRNAETEIVRAPFDSGRLRLAGIPSPVFSGSFELREQSLSPDGNWLLFTNEDPPQQLHLVRPDGSGFRQLTNEGDRNRQGAWSPDGKWIVFQTTRGDASLAAIRSDGSEWQPIPVGPGLSVPIWSPDGSTIAAFDNTKGGMLFDVRGGLGSPVARLLPPVADGALFWPNAWSPDGALLAGRSNRAGQTADMVVRSMAEGRYLEPDWSRGQATDVGMGFVDRFHLVYSTGREIRLGDLRGGEPILLHASSRGHRVGDVSVSRDGRWITWIDRADESDIWLMTLDGAAPDAPATTTSEPK